MQVLVGDLLTGRRIQTVPVLSGSWSDVLNREGDLDCTVSLRDPDVRALGLAQSAAVGKAFLAIVEGDAVLQAGPVVRHSFSQDGEHLTITAGGMWEFLNDFILMPYTVLNPADPLTDTRFSAVVSDPNDPGYPWPTDTRKTYQGIIRAWLAQMQGWPGGNVPINLPAEIVPANDSEKRERWEKGANLAFIGPRIADLTNVLNGPDFRLAGRFTSDKLGIQWDALIGTPAQPQIYSPQDVVFNVGVDQSSISNLQYEIDGRSMGSQAFASGGRGTDTTLISTALDSTLLNAGYPMRHIVDSSHSTVSEQATLDGYALEAANLGRTPIASMSFDHDLASQPFLTAFNVGDFASVRVRNNPYLETGTVRMRITARSGTVEGTKVHIELQPAT